MQTKERRFALCSHSRARLCPLRLILRPLLRIYFTPIGDSGRGEGGGLARKRWVSRQFWPWEQGFLPGPLFTTCYMRRRRRLPLDGLASPGSRMTHGAAQARFPFIPCSGGLHKGWEKPLGSVPSPRRELGPAQPLSSSPPPGCSASRLPARLSSSQVSLSTCPPPSSRPTRLAGDSAGTGLGWAGAGSHMRGCLNLPSLGWGRGLAGPGLFTIPSMAAPVPPLLSLS